MHLSRFPRIRLAHLPTPLEPMKRLSKELGTEIWIKRDDCTGMSTGGNKTRKLEFLMAEALEQGADMVMTQGATQTNHGRQTAAFAAKLGLDCHILLEDRTGYNDANYNHNGNVLLDHLHGATTQKFPGGHDMAAEMERAADAKRAEGRNVYVIPGGESVPIGCPVNALKPVRDSEYRVQGVAGGIPNQDLLIVTAGEQPASIRGPIKLINECAMTGQVRYHLPRYDFNDLNSPATARGGDFAAIGRPYSIAPGVTIQRQAARFGL